MHRFQIWITRTPLSRKIRLFSVCPATVSLELRANSAVASAINRITSSPDCSQIASSITHHWPRLHDFENRRLASCTHARDTFWRHKYFLCIYMYIYIPMFVATTMACGKGFRQPHTVSLILGAIDSGVSIANPPSWTEFVQSPILL